MDSSAARSAGLSPIVLVGCALALAAGPVFASPEEMGKIGPEDLEDTKKTAASGKIYSPYVGRAYPDQVFFGDMHFHTTCPSTRG